MVKIDLITGFLGSGKTTLIQKYAAYLIKRGNKICILENDYGAVNVDMLMLNGLRSENCELEMVAGGCDYDCHKRRFKTKLIAMAMAGYDRVVVEPSGIFDVDEFFDTLYEEPLDRWYEKGNVIAVVDAMLTDTFSKSSEYLLASQIADAGLVVLSHVQEADEKRIREVKERLNEALSNVKCPKKVEEILLVKDWDQWTEEDYVRIAECGFMHTDYVKYPLDYEHAYGSVYFFHLKMSDKVLRELVRDLMRDPECGNIFRIKGFMRIDNGCWLQVNATRRGIDMKPVSKGQEVLIVIGEELNEEKLQEYIQNAV